MLSRFRFRNRAIRILRPPPRSDSMRFLANPYLAW